MLKKKSVTGILCYLFLLFGSAQAQINRPIGTNLNSIVDYSPEFVFVDVFKQSRDWISHEYGFSAPWSSGVSIPLGSNGYPLEIPYNDGMNPPQQCRGLMYFGALENLYPGGSYRLMASGTGQIRLWGAAYGTFTCPVDTFIMVDNSLGGIALEIDASLVTDPVHDIHFIMPGHETTFETDPFYPKLIEYLDDFQVIRFMDWMETNSSPVANWSDRNTKNYYSQTLANGVAYEYIVELCNLTQKKAWICIPHQADDNYIAEMARFFRDSLDPDLKLYVEYSNEVWNGIFEQHYYADSMGQVLGYAGQPWERAWQYTAKRSADVFQIFENEFQNNNRIVKVLPTWAASAYVTDYIITRFNDPVYNPTQVSADALASAPYFAGAVANNIGDAGLASTITVSEILDSMQLALQEAFQHMDDLKALADSNGLEMIAYEGGQHLVAGFLYNSDTAYVNKLLAANRDPRMENMYCEYFEHWYDSTQASLFCNFSSHSQGSQYGSWGVKEYYEDTLAPKYLGLINCVFSENQIDAPIALNDNASTNQGFSVCVAVLLNDLDPNGDAMTLSIAQTGSHGPATVDADTMICYNPDAGFTGLDTIWYEVCDTGCPPLCAQAMLVIEVLPYTSVNELAASVKVFPVPSLDGKIKLQNLPGDANIELYDLSGRAVIFEMIKNHGREAQLSVDGFRGMALLKVEALGQVFFRKVLF